MHKNKLKMIKDLNVRPETTKVLEENIGNNFLNISHRNIFEYMSPLARETKAKLNSWGYTQDKKLLQSKGNRQQSKEATY